MKLIPLSQGQHAMVDDEDYDFLIQYRWHAHKKPGEKTFYAKRITPYIEGKRTSYFMHREILKLTDKKIKVDHIDHNGLNCQRSNMRLCSDQENSRNKTKRKKGSSQYHGVFWHKAGKAWTASVAVDGKKVYLGLFKDETDAAIARDEAVKKHYGEFANLNFK